MKKKQIQLIAISVVLLGLLGAFLALRAAPPIEEESASAADVTYLTGSALTSSADAGAPARIDIQADGGNYTIVNKSPGGEKDELTIEGWENLSLDTYSLGAAANAAKAMEIKQVVNENHAASELGAFGLPAGRAIVGITGQGGEKTEIIIGAEAPGGEGSYVMKAGDPAVYLVKPTMADPFVKPALEYINKAVTEADTEQKSFDRLVISGSAYESPIIIERSPETQKEAAGMILGSHRMTAPGDAGISMDALELLSGVFGVNAETVEAVGDDAATLGKYGLGDPEMSVAVTGADEAHTFTLRLSEGTGEDGAPRVYIMKSGSPVIYSTGADALAWFKVPEFELMERMPILPNIDTVASVSVATPDKTYMFELEGEGEELKVTFEGKELDVKNFRQFYQTLVGASYSEEIPDNESEFADIRGGQPLLEVRYRYKDSRSPDTASFFEGPVRRAVMSANGGDPYYTTSIYVDRVIEDVAKVAAGETVKSFL